MNKSQIRVRLLERRERFSLRVKSVQDKKIIHRLIKFPLFRRSKEFFTYLSHRGEVSTDSLIQKLFEKKKIIVPKIRSRAICLYELKHPGKFETGKFGIREPKFCLPKRVWNEIDVALIPAVAFDLTGHRIGFGGGYFDRLLKKLHCTTRPSHSEAKQSMHLHRPSHSEAKQFMPRHHVGATFIGLAYEFQIIDKVETHAYDVPVDFIITEKRLIRCQPFRSKIRKSTKSSRPK